MSPYRCIDRQAKTSAARQETCRIKNSWNVLNTERSRIKRDLGCLKITVYLTMVLVGRRMSNEGSDRSGNVAVEIIY